MPVVLLLKCFWKSKKNPILNLVWLKKKKKKISGADSWDVQVFLQKMLSKIAEVGFSCLAEALGLFSKKHWPQKTSAGGNSGLTVSKWKHLRSECRHTEVWARCVIVYLSLCAYTLLCSMAFPTVKHEGLFLTIFNGFVWVLQPLSCDQTSIQLLHFYFYLKRKKRSQKYTEPLHVGKVVDELFGPVREA